MKVAKMKAAAGKKEKSRPGQVPSSLGKTGAT
jgi:hypothetical protein